MTTYGQWSVLNLSTAALDWSLAHVTKYGDTDVLPTPFEFQAVQHDWSAIRDYLSKQDVLEWRVRRKLLQVACLPMHVGIGTGLLQPGLIHWRRLS
jgi:hypothetical protein